MKPELIKWFKSIKIYIKHQDLRQLGKKAKEVHNAKSRPVQYSGSEREKMQQGITSRKMIDDELILFFMEDMKINSRKRPDV